TAHVACDQSMTQLLSSCISNAGYESIALVSGAGHDAVPMSSIAPVCMLFVRCFKGISHHPLEHADAEDISAALEIASNFINELINKHR
ncbi:MAG: M20/M25/M40 family metallo-hydrolase, partial [Chitinophagaceae bacterium]